MPERSNRVKVLYLPEDFILAAVAGLYGNAYQFLRLPKLPIPDGARAIACSASWDRRAIGLLVEHESFDEVPGSERPPEMVDQFEFQVVSIPLVENGKLPPSYEALQSRVKELETAIAVMQAVPQAPSIGQIMKAYL